MGHCGFKVVNGACRRARASSRWETGEGNKRENCRVIQIHYSSLFGYQDLLGGSILCGQKRYTTGKPYQAYMDDDLILQKAAR